MSLFPLEGSPWDPMMFTAKLLGLSDPVNNLIWFLFGTALVGYAFAALVRKEILPLLSKAPLKRFEVPLAALIVGMTFLIQAGNPELLSQLVSKFFGIDI